jgi:hypothetical protein
MAASASRLRFLANQDSGLEPRTVAEVAVGSVVSGYCLEQVVGTVGVFRLVRLLSFVTRTGEVAVRESGDQVVAEHSLDGGQGDEPRAGRSGARAGPCAADGSSPTRTAVC